MQGYKNKDQKINGIGGNLNYFKTNFVSSEPTDKNKTALTKKITEMLCIKDDVYEEVLVTDEFKIFKSNEKHLGILFDHLSIDAFKQEIIKINTNFVIYVFSLGDDDYEDEFAEIKNKIKILPIPDTVLRVYKRIFS